MNNRDNKDNVNLDPDILLNLWDAYAEAGYEKLYKSYSFKKILQVMSQMFEDSRGGAVLDGGCGTGSMLESIIVGIRPRVIVAIDWSEKMLIKAKEKSKKLLKKFCNHDVNFCFERVDMTKKLPYPDDVFDAEVFNISICYLPIPLGWRQAIEEAFRTTKPGGFVYLSTFLKGFNFSNMIKRYKFKALKEALLSPIGIYHSFKLKVYPIKITEISCKMGMKYPDKDDLDRLLNELGFIKRGEKEIFWGMGIAFKLQKPLK